MRTKLFQKVPSQGTSRTNLFTTGPFAKTFVHKVPWKLPFHGNLTLIFIYKAILGLIVGTSRTKLFERGPSKIGAWKIYISKKKPIDAELCAQFLGKIDRD
jgi:hypothetical protein